MQCFVREPPVALRTLEDLNMQQAQYLMSPVFAAIGHKAATVASMWGRANHQEDYAEREDGSQDAEGAEDDEEVPAAGEEVPAADEEVPQEAPYWSNMYAVLSPVMVERLKYIIELQARRRPSLRPGWRCSRMFLIGGPRRISGSPCWCVAGSRPRRCRSVPHRFRPPLPPAPPFGGDALGLRPP
jgi:hypothetical protein